MKTERIYSNIHDVSISTRTQFYPRKKAWNEAFKKAQSKQLGDVITGSEEFHEAYEYDNKIGIQWSWEFLILN